MEAEEEDNKTLPHLLPHLHMQLQFRQVATVDVLQMIMQTKVHSKIH